MGGRQTHGLRPHGGPAPSQGTADLEADFELVSNSSATKFQQSQADLEQASNIRNQTNTLLTRAQEQLLLVECE